MLARRGEIESWREKLSQEERACGRTESERVRIVGAVAPIPPAISAHERGAATTCLSMGVPARASVGATTAFAVRLDPRLSVAMLDEQVEPALDQFPVIHAGLAAVIDVA